MGYRKKTILLPSLIFFKMSLLRQPLNVMYLFTLLSALLYVQMVTKASSDVVDVADNERLQFLSHNHNEYSNDNSENLDDKCHHPDHFFVSGDKYHHRDPFFALVVVCTIKDRFFVLVAN
ncbi:unnamed protein product [Adineta ricciae]|uniref:Uncharacterized protein n=1 Tax=Adineta ricciae TaxID=249248 RepID=A0A814DVH2_ADIRI|nr:unnamed protein product [Adineta ricciae]